jgi:hypothetical protein
MRYLLFTAFSLAVCFAAQSLALHANGGRFTKNESNFFSSIARIQAGARGEVNVAFLGSSLTGRLPDRSHGYHGVANMGCDGGSAIDALRAMDRGILPTAPYVFVELNTMSRAVDPTPSQIALAIETPWFEIGRKIPLLSAYARPSGFFYSILLAGKIGGYEIREGPQDLGDVPGPVPIDTLPDRDWGAPEQALIDEFAEITARLRNRDVKTIFLWLPPRRDGPLSGWMKAIPAQSQCLFWDLGEHADPELIRLTDGAHMAGPSAARTVRTVLEGLK